MDTSTLTLRQRKLLNLLRTQESYITGAALAGQLHVTARTIRSDIVEINHFLLPFGSRIASRHGHGYLLETDDEETLKEINKVNSSFLSRDERIRHITVRLCLADGPVSLYDLEDEMYVSRTTLEQDLRALHKTYIRPWPHIGFSRCRNLVSFEADERKRRALLCRLSAENWDYNDRGDLFYHYQYLEEPVVDVVIQEVGAALARHQILMDDINIIYLNLAAAIMYCRVRDGHTLPETPAADPPGAQAVQCADDLLDRLEETLGCAFSRAERKEVALHISYSRLMDADRLSFSTVKDYFSDGILDLADSYLYALRDAFDVDLFGEEDFYITLLQFLRYLAFPTHHFNLVQGGTDLVRANYLVEFEFAFFFQPFALKFYGNYLDDREILYLTYAIAGALAAFKRTAPKFRAVLLCHLNLTATWNLKQQILAKYTDYIHITALLPMYCKDTYDFSGTDLVITTTKKEYTRIPHGEVLSISPFFTSQDRRRLEAAVLKAQTDRLYRLPLPSMHSLFAEAAWHERLQEPDYLSVMGLLTDDALRQGYVTQEFAMDVFRRESLFSFAGQPGVALLHSMVPAPKSRLAVATLEHRVKWNGHKIRALILAAFSPAEYTLIFQLINDLLYSGFSAEAGQRLKTKEEYLQYF